ncbi:MULTISPECIES: hypothetical protein [unclassified Streptomyces]|uniref:hypothetical protein n=1 Tax=unclassified Streptomyces TaxID=2593676 RepID=UPI002E14DC32|nr:hypothetical protein OG452_24295 [Streptomyces sp. NBC_01197]WSS49112.1 hypothetical protein OG708_10935 [Streptomyces sp. NBC_01180]
MTLVTQPNRISRPTRITPATRITPPTRIGLTTRISPTARISPSARTPRTLRSLQLSTVLTGCGAALVPWMFVLAKTLPRTTEVSNWSTAWVGLDALLAVGLGGTGFLLRRQDPHASAAAAATGALLLVDAWFDVTTSAPGPELTTAVALAVGAELPLAAICAVLAARREAERNG